MKEHFARLADAIAVAARKSVQVEMMWQQKLEEDLRNRRQEEENSKRTVPSQAS